jgi:uncharacterized protein YdhG (YjbR/CyaY superfamily)
MPTYKMGGRPVLYFAGWKRHFSLYPVSARLLGALQTELASFEVNRSTVRFPLSQPVPVELIALIAKFRAKEVAGPQTDPSRHA